VLKKRTTCRICGSRLIDIHDFGEYYLPVYKNDDIPLIDRRIPLVLTRCDSSSNEDSCGLIQLRHSTPPYLLYKNYFYRSAVNDSMVKHLKGLYDEALALAKPDEDDVIIDIGCNDGTMLQYYRDLGYRDVVGFDPARTMLKYSSKVDATVIEDYFNSKSYFGNLNKKAKLITSIAMFYDLEDPHEFVSDIKNVLDEKGLWVFEQAYLPEILKQNTFDTICHEHLEYYCLFVIENLLCQHGLEVIDVSIDNTNGGSFKVFAAHKGKYVISDDAYTRIQTIRIEEFNKKLDTNVPYEKFISRIEKNKDEVITLLENLKREGLKVLAYGASTKGSITLQYFGINDSLITACADKNPDKWGLSMVGSNIPIISEEEARSMNPDYFFVLPWHFINGFMEREKEFLAGGGKFIVPMPELKILKQI
jgi:SAM-dependent methyltransferase